MGHSKEILKEGDGKTFPKIGSQVTAHYTGTLEDGTVFDSSRDRGKPFTAPIGVGRLIKLWDICIPKMSVGERAKLTGTPDLCYGNQGAPPLIPPHATLTFDIELLSTE